MLDAAKRAKAAHAKHRHTSWLPVKTVRVKALHVNKGDQVAVISGNDKGTTGEVIAIDRARNRVTVKGVNMRVKHQKPTQQRPKGERLQRESSIHASNVMRIDPTTGKPTRKRAGSQTGPRAERAGKE